MVPVIPRGDWSGRLTQTAGSTERGAAEAGADEELGADEQQAAGEVGAEALRLVLADGRRIDAPGVLNMRDLGGYPASGGVVRWRALFRSDAPHRLDAAGLAALAALDLRTVVDLRTHAEVEIAPSPLHVLAARVAHISILGGDLQSLPLELGAIYRHVVEKCGASIAAAIRVLCAGQPFPALVHCSAGKDRTGIVIAMILSVLGVPDEIIAADYALSGTYLDGGQVPVIGQLQAATGLGAKETEELLGSPPQLILGALARARALGGTVDGYLVGHGVGPAHLTALRAALID
jgi:protein-tyrosine phosphatase